ATRAPELDPHLPSSARTRHPAGHSRLPVRGLARCLYSVVEWQGDVERRSPTEPAGRPDPAAVQAHQLPHDRESQAGPLDGARLARLDAREALEDAVQGI